MFRATRGKAYTKFFNIEVPVEDQLRGMKKYENKLVYICMFEEGLFLRDRITKLLSSFMEPLFEIHTAEIQSELIQVEKNKDDMKTMIRQTKLQLKQYLREINRVPDSEYSLIQIYKWIILKEKAIYSQLNRLKTGERLLMGLMWCPKKMTTDLWD